MGVKEKEKEEGITLKEFFESIPPGTEKIVSNLASHGQARWWLNSKDIYIYCENDKCKGERYFESVSDDIYLDSKSWSNEFLQYRCRNCGVTEKTYAVIAILDQQDPKKGFIFKYGEIPSFGPPIPPRVIKLIGPDKNIFIKGRRAENQGMGIASFAYYRRVVENQKNRIFDEIIKVIERISPDPGLTEELKKAKDETQFTKAVDSIKHGLPQIFLINGHNPLKLLHSALSKGLHSQSDEECLELATSIRVVLTEFTERVNQAVKDNTELKDAVANLVNKKTNPQ